MERRLFNNVEVELEPFVVKDAAELKSRMAKGALLYWTMVRPAHAVLFDPEKKTVAQLAFFKPLWGLQRSKQIRHDRYDGIYQVFLPTTPALEKASAAQAEAEAADSLFAQSEPLVAPQTVLVESVQFEPSI